MDINGTVVVSYRWAENEHYVLAVKQGTLVVKVRGCTVLSMGIHCCCFSGDNSSPFGWLFTFFFLKSIFNIQFAPKADLSRKHWFILKSACEECYTGLNKLETFSKPHLYVKSDSSGFPFMEAVAGRMAWFDMNSACP